MIPVFKVLQINAEDDAMSKIQNHINELQKELYECFLNISSDNISELSLDLTKLKSGQGSEINSDMIFLKGKNGESIKLGYDKTTGAFEVTQTDKDGNIIN